jgi:hypothetical protein
MLSINGNMNKIKLVIIGLLIAYSIYTIIAVITSDISGMLEGQINAVEILIMFPIVIVFGSIVWAWLLPKFSSRLRDNSHNPPFPNMRTKLSESPLEWLYMLAFFFIIPSASFELSILVGHGEFYGMGLLGTAYGIGLFGAIYLIRRRKRKIT